MPPRGPPWSLCSLGRRGSGRWAAGWSMSSQRRQSSHPGSFVRSGEKPLRKGRLPITITLRHGPILIFLGICSGCSFDTPFSPHTDPRGAGRRGKDATRKTRPGRGLGRRRAGRTYSQLVKPSLKHKTHSPHALVPLYRPHRGAFNNRVNRNPKRSILTFET